MGGTSPESKARNLASNALENLDPETGKVWGFGVKILSCGFGDFGCEF